MSRAARFLSAAVLVALLTNTFAAAVAVEGAQAEIFLGYEIGEERRFQLGPPQALGESEMGRWTIRLQEVFGEGVAAEAVFMLSHQWHAEQIPTEVPLNQITRVESTGTVRVNAYGFPLHITYQTLRHLAGLGEEAYTISYEYENERYRKETTAHGERWAQKVRIRGGEYVDHDGPEGLFVFLPAAPGCLDNPVRTWNSSSSVRPPTRPNAASQKQQQVAVPKTARIVDNADCEESLFINPGLLSLTMPAFWEARGTRRFAFFTPIGPVSEPGMSISARAPGSTRPGTIPNPGEPSDPRFQPLTSSTYTEVEDLRFVERAAVKIGRRTRDLWMLEGPGGLGPIYVDDDGVVMRIDLPAPYGDAPQRWIRMLFPSEY